MILRVGFTGTRAGMTKYQQNLLVVVLHQLWRPDYERLDFHHGQCIGSDEQSARTAKTMLGAWLVSHPPLGIKYLSDLPADEVWPAREYLDRNHDIVDQAQVMIAAPKEMSEVLRSGTWATIRYARRQGKEPIMLPPLSPEEVRDDALWRESHPGAAVEPPSSSSTITHHRLGP